MIDIDFLPDSYHVQDVKRRARWWQLAVIAMFGAVVAGTALYQWRSRGLANARLAHAEPLVAEAKLKETKLAHLQSQLQSEHRFSQLYAYLELRWPRTQIVSAVLQDVPEELIIEELNMTYGRRPTEKSSSGKPTRGKPEDDSSTAEVPPPTQDLQALQVQYEPLDTVVLLQGSCQQPTTLHLWLAKLESQRLFTRVELQSMETIDTDASQSHLKFHAQLTVAEVRNLASAKSITQVGEKPYSAQSEVLP